MDTSGDPRSGVACPSSAFEACNTEGLGAPRYLASRPLAVGSVTVLRLPNPCRGGEGKLLKTPGPLRVVIFATNIG